MRRGSRREPVHTLDLPSQMKNVCCGGRNATFRLCARASTGNAIGTEWSSRRRWAHRVVQHLVGPRTGDRVSGDAKHSKVRSKAPSGSELVGHTTGEWLGNAIGVENARENAHAFHDPWAGTAEVGRCIDGVDLAVSNRA